MNSDALTSKYVDTMQDFLENTESGSTCTDPYIQHYSGSMNAPLTEVNLKLPNYSTSSSCSRAVPPKTNISVKSRLNVSERNLLCMSIRGDEIVVGGADHGLHVIKSTCGVLKPTRTLYSKKFGHAEWVTAVVHTQDARVVSGGMDSKICVWRGVQCKDLVGHVGSISAIQPLGNFHIISSSYDRSLKIWDINKTSPLASMHGHKGAVLDFALFSDNKAVSGGRDGRVFLWDASRAASVTSFVAHTGHVTNTKRTCDENIVVTGGSDGFVRFWDVRVPRCLHEERLSEAAAVTVLESNQDNRMLGAVTADNVVTVFDTRTFGRSCSWTELNTNHIYSAKICCEDTVLLGTGNGDIILRNRSGDMVHRVEVDSNAIRCIETDGNGYIIAATDDGNVISF
jgi:WD40 repeat protein